MKKRVLALLLALVMVMTVVPAIALAEDTACVAKIGDTGYATLADAIAAANQLTGDVTVEIYGKAEYTAQTADLIGAYDSISFVGMTNDAEISITRNGSNGYISGSNQGNDCKVNFTNLILSKAAGYFASDAGFMNVAFTVYRTGEITYTNCTFPNGACAAGPKTTYTSCSFAKSYDKYGLWAYGAEVVVNKCTFTQDRGIKMYAEGKAKTTALTVTDTNFSAVTAKPAIVLTYGKSVVLSGNTYSSTPGTGVFELDKDGDPNGTTVTADITDIACMNDNYDDCGVLVDGKIYTTITDAAAAAKVGSEVTLYYGGFTDKVELPVNTTLDKNGYTADNVTIATFGSDVVASAGSATVNEDVTDSSFNVDNIKAAASDEQTQTTLQSAAAGLNIEDIVGTEQTVKETVAEEAEVEADTIVSIVVEVRPYLNVQVEEVNKEDKTIKLDIAAMYNVVAVANVGTETKEVELMPEQTMEVPENTSITITIPLPEGFIANENVPVTIRHTKDAETVHTYETTITKKDGVFYATFENPNGFSTFEAQAADPVAQVGSQNFDSLADAIAAVNETNATVTLLKDITLTSELTITKDVTIKADSAVTITVSIATGSTGEAFGGLHVTGGTLTLGENVTVTNVNSAEAGVSTVTATGEGAKVVVATGATVKSECKNNAIEAANGAIVTIDGGTVYGTQYMAAYATGSATIEVKDGQVGDADYAVFGLGASKTAATTGGKIIISGGTVYNVVSHEAADSLVTVSGGTVNGTLRVKAPAAMTITGGTINGTLDKKDGATLTITGGTFNDPSVLNYLANGFEVINNGDGTYDVQEKDDEPEQIKVHSASVDMGNTLDMYFYIKKSAVDGENYTAKITMNGDTKEFAFKDWGTDETGWYYFVVFDGILAKQMTDEITVEIYSGDTKVSETWTDSIQAYVGRLLQKEGVSEDAKNAAKAMLRYGSAAQVYKNYKKENLADSILEATN